MDANEKTLNTFTTRVRQMILQYKEIEEKNVGLTAKVDELNAQIKLLQAKLVRAKYDYDNLKIAKMIEISDGDMDNAKSRVAKMIRDVNKCITLLSDK